MKRIVKNGQAGFSLIELMVVVAIIGILAAVAVPNFQKFQMKAKQAEAKTNLGGIYTAESAFLAQWNQYYGDFRDIGFAPEGQLTYRVGFAGAGAATTPAGYAGPSGNAAGIAAVRYTTAPGGNSICAVAGFNCQELGTATALPAAATAAAAAFVAGASGNINPSNPNNDQWQINQLKQITNPVSDL